MIEIRLIILIFILMFSSIGLGYLGHQEIESLIGRINNMNTDSPEECQNLSLERTAYCLNNYVKDIYKYNVTQDIRKLSLEELKENGGDCKNWAELYYDMGDSLGFHVKRPVVTMMKGEFAHTFTVMSDETGYCVLDQRTIECFEIKLPDRLKEK